MGNKQTVQSPSSAKVQHLLLPWRSQQKLSVQRTGCRSQPQTCAAKPKETKGSLSPTNKLSNSLTYPHIT